MEVDGDLFYHFLHKVHHPFIILVGNIEFHLCKLRVVKPAHAFISEIFAEFIYPVISSYDQPFQIQLIGNTQIEGHVQAVVMGLERTGSSTTVQWL